MKPPSPRLVAAIFLTAFLTPSVLHAESDVSAFRSKMEKWVESRQILSEEKADWIVEKESLKATRDLLRRERNDLREQIAAFETAGAGAEEERRNLLLERAEFQRSASSLVTRVRVLEEEVLAVAARLPDPLRKRLELLLVQIPEDPEKTRTPLGQRLMNVLGVLNQTEKWNNTATFVGETRALAGGDSRIQIRTLYWGLGQAVYVDTKGELAGVGRPGADGWIFEDVEGLATDAQLLLDIYEGNVDTIAFVPVPVDVE